MNTDNGWLVLVLLIGILVGSNLLMFAWARGMRGTKFDWLNQVRGFGQPLEKQQRDLDELSQRVKALEKEKKDKE